MTPGQYRLHRLSTMRAAMRASARFLSLDECILPFISVSFLEDDEPRRIPVPPSPSAGVRQLEAVLGEMAQA